MNLTNLTFNFTSDVNNYINPAGLVSYIKGFYKIDIILLFIIISVLWVTHLLYVKNKITEDLFINMVNWGLVLCMMILARMWLIKIM
jgi:hypothetical protein